MFVFLLSNQRILFFIEIIANKTIIYGKQIEQVFRGKAH